VSDSATIDSVKTTEHGAGSARLLDGVTKSYDAKSTPAVDNITMEIPTVEIVMVVGRWMRAALGERCGAGGEAGHYPALRLARGGEGHRRGERLHRAADPGQYALDHPQRGRRQRHQHDQYPGSFGVRQAMLNGDANVSPEYTGTGWINYMGNEQPIKDERAQWQAVNEGDQPNQLTWLPPAPMNNTYAFAIREAEAKRLGVTKLSDLARLDRSDLTFCVESEFASRNDGFVPMLRAYGLTRDALGRITHLDTGVIYTATANGDCNFGEVFTTDGRIPALNLRVLEDDKQFFPLYNLTEVIETDLLTAHPELADIFAQLNPKLTNEPMMALNAKVDTDGDDPALVARDWLFQQGLLT
jgi:osmoprotectant transport system substrate-binding protein